MASPKTQRATSSSASKSTTANKTRRNQGRASGSSTSSGQKGLNEREKFQISCLRNARYHEDRELFFARLHKFTMFVVVAGGTASFAPVVSNFWASVVITLAALMDLVFDVSGKARTHASLRRRVYDILAQAEDKKRNMTALREQSVRIYADEPPTMLAVNAMAYNNAMSAFGRPPEHHLVVNWYQRLFRHIWSFGSTEFKTKTELVEAEAN